MTRTALVPAVFALVGTLVGYAIAEASRAPRATPTSPPALSKPVVPAGTLSTGDDALVLELRALGDRIEAAVARRGDQRTPVVGAAAADNDRIVALLERCTTLIERLEREVSHSNGAARLSAPDVAPANAFDAFTWGEDDGDSGKRLTQELMFSSRQDILDRFGKPTAVYNSNGEQWWYFVEEPNGDQNGFNVRFHDGFVTSVDL